MSHLSQHQKLLILKCACAAAPHACRMGGGDAEHPFATDPPAMAVLSAFRQVLRNTQGIIIDSGAGLGAWQCALTLHGAAARNSGGAEGACLRASTSRAFPGCSLLIATRGPSAPCCSALTSHARHLEQGFPLRYEGAGGWAWHGMAGQPWHVQPCHA